MQHTSQDKSSFICIGLVNGQSTKFLLKLLFVFIVSFLIPAASSNQVFAYSNNMDASVVIGQPNFTSNSANQGGSPAANTLNGASQVFVKNGKLFVFDGSNNRALIYNQIPTTNNVSADIVIGQPDFSSSTANNGGISAKTLNGDTRPNQIVSDGTKVVISDLLNNRVLIWNNIPSTNFAAADVVLGQPNFTSSTINNGGISAHSLYQPMGVSIDPNGRLIVSDFENDRVLIWNSIPTTSNKDADLVIGQQDFVTVTDNGTPTDKTFRYNRTAFSDGQNLFVYDETNCRILIWKGFPTQNYEAADVVLGANDFTTNACSNPATASGPLQTQAIYSNGNRLAVADNNRNRILVWNSIPTTNGQAADIVVGQSNFTSSAANQGGSTTVNTLSSPRGVWFDNDRLIVGDQGNRRILIFNNIIKKPNLTLSNSPENRDNNLLRLSGNARVDSPYIVKNVQYSINGGSFSSATPSDGSFDSTSEEYFFDFDSSSNRPKDSKGNVIDGYTVRVKSTNNNTDTIDNLFYFSPFNLNSPADNSSVSTAYPSFEFSVNKQRVNLMDNLQKYQVQVKKGGSNSTTSWETLIDGIPIDFRSVKNNRENKQWETYGNLDTNNGVYETDSLYAIYSEDSSQIKVYSKTIPMSGTYQWKVIAIDKAGHSQETGTRNLYVNVSSSQTSSYFPLAILNISGLGDPNINTFNLSLMKDSYTISSLNPEFYGIAWSNSKVTLRLTEQNCENDCVQEYTSIANQGSRYGINIPKGKLKSSSSYLVNASVLLDDKYNELPQFVLKIIPKSIVSLATAPINTIIDGIPDTKIEEEKSTASPSSSPTSTPINQQNTTTDQQKRCIWFICF